MVQNANEGVQNLHIKSKKGDEYIEKITHPIDFILGKGQDIQYINALARCSMSWFMLYFPCSSIKGIQHRKRRRERRPKSKLKLKLEHCVLTKEAFFPTYLAIYQSVRPLLYYIPFHIYTNASYSIFNLLPF